MIDKHVNSNRYDEGNGGTGVFSAFNLPGGPMGELISFGVSVKRF